MRALGLLTLVALVALAYGLEVYVFKVWLPQPYSGFGIYVPGVEWELGEAAWLFMAPVERGEAVHALTGGVAEVKLYDARVVYIAIPATKPADAAEADAWLETPVGRCPLRIEESHGTMLTLVDSEKEIFEVLREAGYSPKYMGEARLVEGGRKLPEPPRPEPFESEEDEAPPEPDNAVFLLWNVALLFVVLGVAAVLIYAAVAKYGGLRGFLYVVFVNLVSTALMWATDVAAGLATAANEVGFHPYERWETALFLALSAAYMGLGNIAVEQIYRAVGWKPRRQ